MEQTRQLLYFFLSDTRRVLGGSGKSGLFIGAAAALTSSHATGHTAV